MWLFFFQIASFPFHHLLTYLMTKAGFGHSSREAGCGRNHRMVDVSKLSQQLAKKHENNTFSRGKGTLKVIRRSNPGELRSSLAVIKTILLTANRSNSILLGLITTSVWTCAGIYNYYYYYYYFCMGTGQRRAQNYDCNIDCLHINSSHCTSSLSTSFRSSPTRHCW